MRTAQAPLSQQQIKIVASGGQSGDQFGARVAISGDIAVVGANRATVNGQATQGAVYVFVRQGAAWVQQSRLLASDGVAGDQFGAAVAIDGNTIVVGARFAESNYGKAYVFTRNGQTGAWVEQKLPRTLYPGSAAFPGQFGFSVAISGTTIVVGNPRAHGTNNVPTGIAHVFVFDGTTWSLQVQFSGTSGVGLFGQAVAVSGGTFIVGDPGAFFDTPNDPSHPFGIVKGAAYVFTSAGATWSFQQQLSAPDGEQDDFFGQAVSLDGDSAIVGAPGDDINGRVDQGSMSIWTRSNNTWSQQYAITGTDSAAGDNFGTDVAIRGNTALVGALFHAVGSNANQGSAYVFSYNAGLWSQTDQLFAADGAANDRFGVAVALTHRSALVGAFGKQSLSGAAYIYESPDTDGDGLPDDWEINGITVDSSGVISVGNTGNGVFINLPAMGADPKHKDIFVHLDWMQDSPAGLKFKPNPRAIKMVMDSFAIAPVDNPDGKPGINLHVDFGPTSIMNPVTGETWGTKSFAGEVPYAAVLEGTAGSAADWPIGLDLVKTDRFNPNGRSAVFHYALYCEKYGDGGNKVGGGISRGIDASDFLLGVGSTGFNPIQEASFFMHELGHNLGLHHGGGDEIQNKPNYISIMNYRFDYIGTLKGSGGRSIDYSRRALDPLNETNLDETVGINDPDGHLTTWNFWSHVDSGLHNPCIDNPGEFNRLFYPTKALDWNCNGVADPAPVSVDVNSDAKCVRSSRADGLLYSTPAGDDVVIGRFIMSGPNRVCETAPACGVDANGQPQCDVRDDNQNGLPAGYVEPTVLTGFNDWPNLRFDGGEKIGSIHSTTTAQPNEGTADADTIVPPHELSTEEIAAEIPAPLIEEMNLAPLDVVTVSKQASGGSLVATFDGSGSTAVTGTIVKWTWDFGDGTTGTGANVTHTYNTSGDYFATLTVTDSNGHITLVPLLQRITVGSTPSPTPTASPTPSASPTPASGRYSFTKVIDNTQIFNGRQFDFLQSPPQMNDSRTLVFGAHVEDASTHNLVDLGYFRIAPGGTPTVIASIGTGFFTASQFGGYPSINAGGLVSVNGASDSNYANLGIYVGSGGSLTKIAGNETGSPFLDFNNSNPWINTSGTVAFRADLRASGAGIFSGNGGAVATIVDSGFGYLGNPAMNDAGTVAFWGRTNAGAEGIFASSGGAIQTIADTSGEFSSFGALPTINVGGAVAFQAYRDDNSNGIFLAKGGVITTIADSNGAFGNFYPGASINNNGTVVFEGFLKTGDGGIFTGPDPITNKVIAVGDSLFGGIVTNVAFLHGLNNNNDVAFVYRLDTKVNGIFVEGLAIASPRTVLANISTRMLVQTDDNVLIGGFIVTGTQPKKLIVRGMGPSLPVNGKLLDPTLELRDSTGALVEANDNWGDAANRQEIIDSKIPPNDPAESAILRSVLPGAYTAILRGANNSKGVGVVEVYDLDLTVDSKLANISTRGLVQTGDNVMIGGFIIAGSAPQKVIIRAIGPSLSIPGKLEDPTLELHDQNGGLIDSNDNWIDSPNKQAILDSSVPPTNNLESAIVATLPSSGAQYTGIVRGTNSSAGIAVVEVYALQ